MLLLHHAGVGIPGESRTRICPLGEDGSGLLSYRDEEEAEHQGLAPRTPLEGAAVFKTASSTGRTCSENGSPTWTRTTTTRLTDGHATLTSSGNEALPAGIAPALIRLEDGCLDLLGHGSYKWSGTPVTLRVSRRPKRRGLLSSSCP